MNLTALGALMLVAGAAGAQTPSRSTAEAAKAFSLDLPPADTPRDATLPSATFPRLPDAPADQTPVASPRFTLDTPIAQIVLDPRGKAVLDRDLPGLSDDPNLPKFSTMSLRRFQPMTGGQLTDALLAKTGADLAALGSGSVVGPATAAPIGAMPAPDRRMESGR